MGLSHYKLTARDALYGNWMLAVIVSFVAALLGGLVTGSNIDLTFGLDSDDLKYLPAFVITYLKAVAPFALILGIVQLIIGGTVQLGYCRFLLNLHDWQSASIRDIFSQFHRFADGFCLAFLRALFVSLWTLLLVIPGIVAAYRYAMAPFILAEHPEMRASEAITASKYMMSGSKMELFFLDLSFIGWALLSALTLGIGLLWLNPYHNMTHAAFYRRLSP